MDESGIDFLHFFRMLSCLVRHWTHAHASVSGFRTNSWLMGDLGFEVDSPGSSVSVTELVVKWRFLGFLGAPGGSVYTEGYQLCWSTLHARRVWATQVCLSEDTPIGRKSVGIIFAAFWGFYVLCKCAWENEDSDDGVICHSWFNGIYYCMLKCVLALVRLPKVHGYHARMVIWIKGASQAKCM